MKLQKAVVKETVRITIGTVALSVIMNIVFVLLGQWDLTVLWGTLLGCVAAIANFLLLGITVQIMTAEGDEKRGKQKLQLSYSLRMLGLLGILILGVQAPIFMWVAVVLPLLFPRITIAIMQISGMYKPEKKQNNEEKGEETLWK